MGVRLGSGYKGSSAVITTSKVNTEILPNAPQSWTIPYSFYKLEFRNYNECTIKINGGDAIYLQAGQGFTMNEVDKPIYSFIVVEANVQFTWLGAF